MSELLKAFDNVECSMDDILIFANSKAELNEVVDKVMKRLFLAGLKLNKEKCVLSAEKVKFLGHILDENGVSPDPEKKLQHPTTRDCIEVLKRWFSVHGVPEVFESDNGSQYASKMFNEFLESWGIQKSQSSPYHPQSNGLAERAVEASKVLLKRCQKDNSDIALALLNVRNTPREAGLMSINQRLMSRTTRSLRAIYDKFSQAKSCRRCN
ncbi:hypothetical protein JTE90_019232 [Oedothorax gibbosus]|uniref:Integrase catalytic domain-containing protein n=1 Tax=Oedothorax gibbosus TaxID=931172 RepID=A0AAV6UT96_9ARAC|nr:hypothetical protein JTE90_019232 [Oedothorax gibbosus]